MSRACKVGKSFRSKPKSNSLETRAKSGGEMGDAVQSPNQWRVQKRKNWKKRHPKGDINHLEESGQGGG